MASEPPEVREQEAAVTGRRVGTESDRLDVVGERPHLADGVLIISRLDEGGRQDARQLGVVAASLDELVDEHLAAVTMKASVPGLTAHSCRAARNASTSPSRASWSRSARASVALSVKPRWRARAPSASARSATKRATCACYQRRPNSISSFRGIKICLDAERRYAADVTVFVFAS